MKNIKNDACPIVYASDIFGDRWSIIILRNMLIHNKKYYRQLLNSGEGISTNILSSKLQKLIQAGLITKNENVTNRAQITYTPTQKTVDLLPVFFSIIHWGIKHNPNTDMSLPLMQEVTHNEIGLKKRLLKNFNDVLL